MSDNPVYEEWKKTISSKFRKGDVQEDLQKVITQKPDALRERLRLIEMNYLGYEEGEDGLVNEHGIVLTEEEVLNLKNVVNDQMLKSSPALREYKVQYRDGALVPDFTLHEKEKRGDKKWSQLSKKE